jgi:hypothetical protein
VPVHGIKEPDLADKNFQLPKIPVKSKLIVPPVQMSMAEIVESSEVKKLEDEVDDLIENVEMLDVPKLEINLENINKCNTKFADTQKVSIGSIIKLAQSNLDGKTINVVLTKQQEDFIGEVKIEWQAYIRAYFKDKSIVLQIQIDETQATIKKAYTSEEQFQEEIENNELFRKFVNKLKLKLKK